MISLNVINIMGYVGSDPELRRTNDGDGVLSFRVAQTARWKGADNVERERVTWFRCSLFGKRADALSSFLRKGAPVFVTGSIRTQEYEKNGEKRSSWEVRVDDIQLLASKPKSEAQSDAQPKGTEYPPADNFADDDIPF